LALDQAGAYIEQTHSSMAAYLQLFERDPCQLLEQRDGHADHPCSVVHTFTGAFERLAQANPAAGELLSLCCFLAPAAIPEALLTEHAAQLGPALAAVVAQPLPFNALCQDLLASGLLRRDGQTHTLTIPALVGAILKGSMPEAVQRQWAQRALSLLSEACPQPECVPWAPQERELAQAGQEVPEAGEVRCKTGRSLLGRGGCEEASALLQPAVAPGQGTTDLSSPRCSPHFWPWGNGCADRGKDASAQGLASYALAAQERHLEVTHVQMGKR